MHSNSRWHFLTFITFISLKSFHIAYLYKKNVLDSTWSLDIANIDRQLMREYDRKISRGIRQIQLSQAARKGAIQRDFVLIQHDGLVKFTSEFVQVTGLLLQWFRCVQSIAFTNPTYITSLWPDFHIPRKSLANSCCMCDLSQPLFSAFAPFTWTVWALHLIQETPCESTPFECRMTQILSCKAQPPIVRKRPNFDGDMGQIFANSTWQAGNASF